MEIFKSILALLAGTGVFITGMNLMSSGLQKLAGPGMKKLIAKLTSNRFVGVGVGAAVTGIIQSSGATTVMVIGFVNAGAMTLMQATALIMGANIGTTVTGLLVSLQSLDISLYASVLAFIGVMMTFFSSSKVKQTGNILCGLGLIFIGLDLMSAAFENDAIKDMFKNVFTTVDFPLLLLLLGIIFTALIQSSSAITGLVIVMASSGAISLDSSLFIILGANIGTCVTALLATIGASTNAKRTGIIHLMFNMIGTCIFTIFIWIFKDQVVRWLHHINNVSYEIALFHVIFNLTTTLLLLPFIKQLVSLAEHIIPDRVKKIENTLKYIDDRLLATPSIALMQVKKEIENMAELSLENLADAYSIINTMNLENSNKINSVEDQIDFINISVTKFLVKLSGRLDGSQGEQVGSYYHVVNDIERIGDYAINILEIASEMKEKGIEFSYDAKNELNSMYELIGKMYGIAMNTFDSSKEVNLDELSKYEAETDDLKKKFSIAHFERLSKDNCTMELGNYFEILISYLERVADHLTNIGYSIENPTGDQPLALKGE